MSKQQIGGAVGAIVGGVIAYYTDQNYARNVAYGYSIGSGIGQAATTTKTEGPRVDTNALPTAAEGDPITYVIGSLRVAGLVAWMSVKRNVPTTSSEGKGGGVESTTFTAECDVLFVVACNRTNGVRRIWRYGELVWTNADSADAQSVSESGETDKWRRMTIYTGGAAQLPDPVYEAAVGVGNAPGYRNCTTVFFEGLQLGGGQQLPILNFEVVEEGVAAFNDTNPTPPFTAHDSLAYNAFGVPSLGSNGYEAWTVQAAAVFDPIYIRSFPIAADGSVGPYTATILLPPSSFPYGPIVNYGAMKGCTDETMIILGCSYVQNRNYVRTVGGTEFYFDTPSTTAFAGNSVFAKRGSYLVTGDTNAVSPYIKVNAYDTTGMLLASSATLPDQPQWIAINAASVYVMMPNGNVVELARPSLTITAIYTAPVVGGATPYVLTDDDGAVYWGENLSGSSVYRLNAGVWTVFIPSVGYEGAGGAIAIARRITGGVLYKASVLRTNRLRVDASVPSLGSVQRALSVVVTEMVERTGLLTAADIDVSAIATIYMRGMKIDRPMSVRAVLESLLSPFFVEAFEGDKLTFRPRGGAPVLTIPYEDLGASEGDAVEERLPITRQNDIEVPARVYGRFPNWLDDHQVGKTPTSDRLTTDSLEERAIDIPVVMTPSEAARVVDVAVMDLQIGRITLGPVAVTRKYAALDPTDVVAVLGPDGSSYRARITKINESGLVRQLELVSDDASALVSAARADDTDLSTSIVRNNAAAEIEAMDTPILRDADDAPGHYERISAVGKWSGARLQRSIDQALWTDVEDVTDRATYGIAASALPAWTGGNVVDRTSTLTVDMAYGEFSSITRAALLASRQANLIAVGAPGRWEYLQYQTATVVDADTVILSNLLRGRFGTDAETAAHAGGDRVVLMQPVGLRKVRSATSDIGVARYYRAISFGKLPSSANVETFTDMGRALRPYSATNPRVLRDSSNNATISWHRRTRLATRFGGSLGSAVPLGETVQAWSVDIFSSNTYTTVVRTITSGTSSVTYSAANQTTDGLTPGATIYARVYQLSATVGRGAPLSIAA